MKIAFVWIVGVIVGLMVALPARRAVVHYSEYSLPAPWTGPKIRVWHDGVERVFDPESRRWGADIAI